MKNAHFVNMENEVVKIIFCGLSVEIRHNEQVPNLEEKEAEEVLLISRFRQATSSCRDLPLGDIFPSILTQKNFGPILQGRNFGHICMGEISGRTSTEKKSGSVCMDTFAIPIPCYSRRYHMVFGFWVPHSPACALFVQ